MINNAYKSLLILCIPVISACLMEHRVYCMNELTPQEIEREEFRIETDRLRRLCAESRDRKRSAAECLEAADRELSSLVALYEKHQDERAADEYLEDDCANISRLVNICEEEEDAVMLEKNALKTEISLLSFNTIKELEEIAEKFGRQEKIPLVKMGIRWLLVMFMMD